MYLCTVRLTGQGGHLSQNILQLGAYKILLKRNEFYFHVGRVRPKKSIMGFSVQKMNSSLGAGLHIVRCYVF